MKAAWQYKERWEEENFLRLVSLAENSWRTVYFLIRKINLVLSVAIFIAYKAIKFVLALTCLILTTEMSLRETKEETWMFRQIK